MTRGQSIAIGLIGFAAGVVVGMLIAPKSGKELRDDIRRNAKKATDLYDDLEFGSLTENEMESELVKR
jgi:gas vesicle protein